MRLFCKETDYPFKPSKIKKTQSKYFYMTEREKGQKISITAIARKKSKIVVFSNEE